MSDISTVETLGYVLLGVFISLWLCGVLTFQMLHFFTNYPNERRWLRVFVGILCAADGIQTLMGVGLIWDILIKHFDVADTPLTPTRMFRMYPVLVGLISGSVQIFFAWRIKVLSTNSILFAIIAVLAIPQFAGGIAYTALTIRAGTFEEFGKYIGVIVGWVASSVLCDLVITVTLTVTLRRHRSNRELGEAAQLIHRIKIMSIHNGLVTIIWSLALLIALAAAKGKGGAYYIFLYPLGKVYLITMLASLNSRPVVRPDLDPRVNSVLQQSSSSTPRIPSLILPSSRELMGDVEKIGRPISSVSNHPRTPNRTMEYLPVAQEEDEDRPRNNSSEERPSNECSEFRLLVGATSFGFKKAPSPSRISKSMCSRPRGPRLPTVPCSAAYRSVST